MTRRTLALLAALLALMGAFLLTAPARASLPASIDPQQLVLPDAALPPGTVVEQSLVSANTDADAMATNPIRQLHQMDYADLGRVTGYREKFHFSVSGTTVTVAYVASIFSMATQSHAALDDATGAGSLIALIGNAVSPACTSGDLCRAYAGANGSSTIVYVAFVRGPVLVEMASSSDSSTFGQNGQAIEASLYSLLKAADKLVQAALGAESGSTATPATPTPMATQAPPPAPVVAVNPPLRSFYLALGDSFSYGYLTSDKPADPACASKTAPGFVCIFYRYLQTIKHKVTLNNLSDSGADSCELAGTGHRCYSATPVANPVDKAVAFLDAHPGQVSPITLTIGGNDLLALLGQWVTNPAGTEAMVPGIIQRYRTNLDSILSRLRAAAPAAEIIVTTQPDSFIGLGSPPLPAALPDVGKSVLSSLNTIMKEEAPKYGAVVADAYAAWDSYAGDKLKLDWAPVYLSQGRVEIHPTPLGYKVYGQAVIKASGFLATLHVKSRLGARRIAAGRMEHVKGTTNPAVALTLTVHNPGGSSHTARAQASSSGSFSLTFAAGTRSGKGSARVCARDNAGRSVCGSKLSYIVT